jgi:hypothetical protein
MLDEEDGGELVFPETLSETKTAMAGLIGEITELRTWVRLQYEGRKSGLHVNWDDVRAANEDIARIQGDIEALKKHAAGQREALAVDQEKRNDEKARLKLETAVIQKQREAQAQAAKKDKTIADARKQELKYNAAHNALMNYIKENLPDHWHTAVAISKAAKDAIQ